MIRILYYIMNVPSKNHVFGGALMKMSSIAVCGLALFTCRVFGEAAPVASSDPTPEQSAQSMRIREITSPYMPERFDGPKVKIPGLRRPSLDNERPVWKSVAPGFINVPMNVLVRGETISILIDIGGLIQSTDGGRTWRYLTYQEQGGVSGWETWDFDIHPKNDNIIVVGGRKIYRTEDHGKSWTEIHDGLPPTQYMARGGDFGQIKFNCDGSRLFAAIGTNKLLPQMQSYKDCGSKSLFISDDTGKSFRRIPIDSPFSQVKRIYPHPSDPDCLFISFADGEFYMTENARSAIPKLRKIKILKGEFVTDMCIDPKNSSAMLLTVNPLKKDATSSPMLLRCDNIRSESLEFRKIPIMDSQGKSMDFGKAEALFSVGCNPRKLEQVVVGVAGTDYILISEDGLKSFAKFSLPSSFYCDNNLGHYYGQIENVYFGPSEHAVVTSRIGVWSSDDNFQTLRDLTMTYKNGYFGNNGVGSPANINNISIAKDRVFFSAHDHGAWESDGADCLKWKTLTGPNDERKFPTQPAPWGSYTWLHLVEKIFASYDESFIYMSCNAMMNNPPTHPYLAKKKIFLSDDHGNAWQDITSRLGCGDVYPQGSYLLKILFDPSDSSRQWMLFSDAIYLTEDGAKTFSKLSSPLFEKVNAKNEIYFSDIAFDPQRKILYLGSVPNRLKYQAVLNQNSAPAAFLRSSDMGRTWEVCDIGQNAVRSVGVGSDGTLIVGTQRAGNQPARLIRIPFGAKYDDSMIKLTVGDTPEEVSANQISVWPIVCDGDDVLAYSNGEWVHSDRFYAQGPLLSRDGGKTFQWINDDLPNNNIWSANMKDGKIFLGTTSGLMYWRYR